MRGFSPQAAKEVFLRLPPIFKLLIIFAIVNGLLIVGISSTQFMVVPNTVFIMSKNVGVYWDTNCSNNVGGINWGILEPGENKTFEVYFRNEGNTVFALYIWAADWSSPEAEQYMSFATDYQDQSIGVGEVVPVSLTLSVSPEIRDIESFSFNVIIGPVD